MKADESGGLAIFDLDGTLVDSRADLASAINRTRRRLGLEARPAQSVTEAVGNGMRKLVERTVPERPDIPLDEKLAMMEGEYAAHLLDETRPYPGIEMAVRALRAAGWLTAVLSNKPDPAARAIIAGLKWEALFNLVQGAADGVPLKPDPAAVDFAVAASGYAGPRGRIWMIGDNYTDVAAARLAGIRRCFCAWGFGHLRGETPDATAASPETLAAILNRGGGRAAADAVRAAGRGPGLDRDGAGR